MRPYLLFLIIWHIEAFLLPPKLPVTPSHRIRSPPLCAAIPSDIVSSMERRPWKSGLEPAEDVELMHVPNDLIEGKILSDLEGTLYRNGAGRIRVGGIKYGHWFDGDGFVSAATFVNGKCYFRQKYLKGEKYKAQERAKEGRIGARGVWTQRGTGKWYENILRIPANPINTNVMVLNGKILALCEGGPPFQIDPVSLDLQEAETFGGLKSFFSAHPKIDPDTGMVYNLGLSLGATVALNLMKISAKGELLQQNAMSMTEVVAIHDFVLAGSYMVIFISPYSTPLSSFVGVLGGTKSLGLSYHWQADRPTKVLFFDKKTFELVQEVPIPATSNYHFLNGWESEDGKVVEVSVAKHRSDREVVESQFRDMYEAEFTGQLECETWRYVFDVKKGQLLDSGPLSHAAASPGYELPTVNPRYIGNKNRYAYVNSLVREEGFADSVSKVNLNDGGRFETHDFQPGQFAGEAVFVPKATKGEQQQQQGEDDGYLLVYVYDASRKASDLVILDAKAVTSPPFAIIHLPFRVPYQFHGVWTPITFQIES